MLTIVTASLRRVLYWSQGELVMSASPEPADSLGDFMVRRGALTGERAVEIFGDDPFDAVSRLHEAGLLDLSSRQTMMREWLTAQFVPLFSLDEGTAAFSEDEPISPDRRIFLPSTAGLIADAIRSITNGLVLRRSLGDLKRVIRIAREQHHAIDHLPLSDPERAIAASLTEPETIEAFLKRYASQSGQAAKIIVAMLALGVYTVVEERVMPDVDAGEMQRDMELLAAIGPNDLRSLRAVGLSRQLGNFDHYQLIDVPRAASRAQILVAAESMKKKYEPASYPQPARPAVESILQRIDEALSTLKDTTRRAAYDRLLQGGAGDGAASIQQRHTRRMIADQNLARARELMAASDFYGAIILLRQAVVFAPDSAESWFLLGSCQERNPKWRRDAAESLQMALSLDPNHINAMIALGDLYRSEGLLSRAQTCYEDVTKIEPENQQAKSRLVALKKR